MSTITAGLRPHSTTPCEAVRGVGVEIDAGDWPRRMRLRFRVEGDLARIKLPPPGTSRRRDGLWQHTCFEAFFRPDASASYHEFNFAPSGDWAAYRFGSRRSGRSLPGIPDPEVRFSVEPGRCDLSAELPIDELPELSGASSLAIGACAIIETDDGALSYWALAHGGARPDFHDPATFTLTVRGA